MPSRNPTALDLNGPGREPTEMERYLEKYGTMSLTLLMSRFIEKAPEFPGDTELAGEIGQAVAMLQAALNEASDSTEKPK